MPKMKKNFFLPKYTLLKVSCNFRKIVNSITTLKTLSKNSIFFLCNLDYQERVKLFFWHITLPLLKEHTNLSPYASNCKESLPIKYGVLEIIMACL